MVEAGAEEISEDDMLAAMKFRPGGPRCLLSRLRTSSSPSGSRSTAPSSSRSTRSTRPVEEVQERIFAHYDEMAAALQRRRQARPYAARSKSSEGVHHATEFTEEEQRRLGARHPRGAQRALEKKAMRTMVVETGERVDGRAADEIRPYTW